jgi:hypothetical protein
MLIILTSFIIMAFTYRSIISKFDNKLANKANAVIALEFICSEVNISESQKPNLLKRLDTLGSHYWSRWTKCSRTKERLEKNYGSWLDTLFDVNEFMIDA